jgi:hypothetical protein
MRVQGVGGRKMKYEYGALCNNDRSVGTDVLGEKSVQLSLCPP